MCIESALRGMPHVGEEDVPVYWPFASVVIHPYGLGLRIHDVRHRESLDLKVSRANPSG